MPKFTGPVDFGEFPVRNLAPESAATAPEDPVQGQLWFDSAADRTRYFDGSQWLFADQVGTEQLANKGAAGGYAGLDGTARVPIAQLPASTNSTSPTEVVRADDPRLGGSLADNPLTLREIAKPPPPEPGSRRYYAKADGRLYTQDSAGVERPVAQLHVGPTAPTFEAGQRYLWVQTGLGETGRDHTLWIEDGL